LSGCSVARWGLGTATLDPDFHGCFERGDAPGGQIIIIQESANLLRGTGFGLFDGSDRGWTFTGGVTDDRVATVHVTMEGELPFDVEASRPLSPPPDLTLQRAGTPVLTLSRCP
jgi:hypothetical protein